MFMGANPLNLISSIGSWNISLNFLIEKYF